MDDEIDDAHNERREEERRNALYHNTSTQKVNVIRDDGQEVEDERVYNDEAEAERKNDDWAKYEREYWLKEEV